MLQMMLYIFLLSRISLQNAFLQQCMYDNLYLQKKWCCYNVTLKYWLTLKNDIFLLLNLVRAYWPDNEMPWMFCSGQSALNSLMMIH